MKISIFALSILLIGSIATAGDYKIKIVPVRPMESYPAQATAAEVTIAADPFDTDEKSFTAFDVKDLNSRGYYPIHIIIQNKSKAYLSVRTRNMILITSSGEQLYTTPATILVDDVIKSGLTQKLPTIKEKDVPTPAKKGSPLVDFTSKELVAASMDPGGVIDGFLFFFTPDPKKNLFSGSTLYIPKIEEEGTHKPIGPFTIHLDAALVLKK